MKPLPMITCGILAAALALCAPPAEGARKGNRMDDQTTPSALKEQKFTKRVSRTIELKYLLYLPEGYEKSRDAYPLVLFLHGAGERGDDLQKVKTHGPPKLVEQGQQFPFILVCPQCPEGTWWKMEPLTTLLDEVERKLRVDKTRIYVTGVSMGGYGTWELAMTQPERFAAIVPICGGGRPWMAPLLKRVPVWAFHGAKDKDVLPRESEDMVNALKAAGGDAKLTIYPDATHDSWSMTYTNPDVYAWMLDKVLSPAPREY